MYNVVVGGKLHDAESIMEAGDRIWTLEKLFNLEAGIDSSMIPFQKDCLKNLFQRDLLRDVFIN